MRSFGMQSSLLQHLRTMESEVIDLHIQLERAFVEKIKTTTELEKLCDVTYKLDSFGNSKDRHAYKFSLLFDRMAKLSHFMTTEDFHRIVVFICRQKLYQTVILDTLTKYFIEHNEAVMETSFVWLVYAIAMSGYEPQEQSVFNKLCIEKTLNHFNKMDIEEQISLAYGLSILQICPQEILCQIFSLEYLVLVDKHRLRGQDVSIKIMGLNRCAVLEYPQLNIPWFHESYEDQFINYFDMLDHHFNYLPEALSQVLGGPKFFQKNVLTPYFHPIYAELFLDENKRPVYYSKAKQVQAKNAQYQPIAIVAFAEQSTPLNEDKKLTGILQTYIRQLEIIGYKVVVIRSTEWNSMAMYDEDERVNYLMKKLFTV
ncbi:hypothetical protein CHS0354_009970 [Potamilus streckersoni]|uniref:RAP domain-containing protein n=1 Tax=Potamilus streckersoni TaxID=2493646 RepID=A0AAE0TBD9_9BIVA|nr:hypothetical protein CHS0354_009970 [Potamilus streckersoni]